MSFVWKMIWAFSILAIIYIVICLALFFLQRSLLYFPTSETTTTWGHRQVFQVNDQQINSLVLHPGQGQAVMYFGGNAEQIEESARDYLRYPQYTFYFVNYRGYGGSSGVPHKKGILEDSGEIYRQVVQNHSQVILMGRSLGTGVVTYLARQMGTQRVILITPYDSIEKVAAENFSWFPVKFLLTENFNSYSYVRDLDTNFTVIYAQHDEIIRPRRTENLILNMKNKPLVVSISQANHNNISSFPRYWETLDKVLK